jgi:hypothetical protein
MAKRPTGRRENPVLMIHDDGMVTDGGGYMPTHAEINRLLMRIQRFYQRTTPAEITAHNLQASADAEQHAAGRWPGREVAPR